MGYADVGIDQMICGLNKHEHICEALELFAKEVMPSLKEREDERVRHKEEELAPYIEAALARKPLMPELQEKGIPNIEGMGIVLERRTGKDYASAGGTFADPTRGGAPSRWFLAKCLPKQPRLTDGSSPQNVPEFMVVLHAQRLRHTASI
ncbi:hypothetical protein [Bradyrhizobium arachidis]|uniref:hypothetical protein n=1 Tax=Bradyrhizobium arachidis TaxID=858423 RepID=UPI002203596A|nr:phage tail tube protein [Bradyrhizobium arachidis]